MWSCAVSIENKTLIISRYICFSTSQLTQDPSSDLLATTQRGQSPVDRRTELVSWSKVNRPKHFREPSLQSHAQRKVVSYGVTLRPELDTCGYRLCQAAEASLVQGPGSRRKHADKDAQKSYPAEINFHP